MDLADRIYDLFYKKGFDTRNNRYGLTNAVNDMVKSGAIPDTDLKNKRKVIEDHVKGRVTSIKYDWIRYYCDYFEVSADYLLGFQEKDIDKFQTRTGLTDKAIRRLITNKDYQFVINTLLEKNTIKNFVEALQNDSFYETQTRYISSLLYKTNDKGRIIEKDKKLHGVTIDDLEIYKTNHEVGYKTLQNQLAIVCFDSLKKELEKDEKLRDYFFDQAAKKFSDQLENDIQKLT